jgi:hypothetical protein
MCAPQKQSGLGAPTTSPDERPRLSSIQEPTNHEAGISLTFMPSLTAQSRSIPADSFEVSSAFKAAEGRTTGCSNSSPAEKLVCCLDASCGSDCATQRLRARSGIVLRMKRIRLLTVAFYKGAPPPPQTAVNRRLHSKSLTGVCLIVATNRAVKRWLSQIVREIAIFHKDGPIHRTKTALVGHQAICYAPACSIPDARHSHCSIFVPNPAYR